MTDCNALIDLAKDIYENGPSNNELISLLLAEHFNELRKQVLELKLKPTLAAKDFIEDCEFYLPKIESAIQSGCIDMEIWNANQLFKAVIAKFNRVVVANPDERWIPIAQLLFEKAELYLARDKDQNEFEQYPNLQALLGDFRGKYCKVRNITKKFLDENRK